MSSPLRLLIAGAACLSGAGVFLKLSGAGAGTGAFLRFALALPVLAAPAWRERRRLGPRPPRLRALDAAAGVFLGADMVFWSRSVVDAGAGVATVLVNVQVVVFPLLAWVVERARPPLRFALAVPVLLGGVALAAGLAGHGATGPRPAAGALSGALAGALYAGYLYLARRGGGRAHKVSPTCTATASGALTSLLLGGALFGVRPGELGAAGWGWLIALALLGQVASWLLISTALPRLPANTGATLLVLQPVLAFAFAVAAGERPSLLQLAGCAAVVAAVWWTAAPRPVSAPARRAPPGRT